MCEIVKLSASCTWNITSGCALPNAIQTEITHEDLFYKPPLDDILREDRAILLAGNSAVTPCELELRIFPRFKISSVHCLCSAPKIELFLSDQKEYAETVYGVLVTDDDNEDNDINNRAVSSPGDVIDAANESNEAALRSYRYDIEVLKSGVVELTLKLLAPTNELCIFGLLVLVGPNPNGITTQTPPIINLDNVQAMLTTSSQKLSPSAEKCKLFMEAYSKHASSNTAAGPHPSALLEHMKQMMATQVHPQLVNADTTTPTKEYIEQRLQQLENRMMARIDAFAAQQATKLDNILKLLEESKT